MNIFYRLLDNIWIPWTLHNTHTPLDSYSSVRFREMSVFIGNQRIWLNNWRDQLVLSSPEPAFFSSRSFDSRVGSAARLLGSLSKGVFRWNWGNFVGASSIRFPLMALYLVKWYHHKMSYRRESPRREFTPVVVPWREFHSGTKSRNGIM